MNTLYMEGHDGHWYLTLVIAATIVASSVNQCTQVIIPVVRAARRTVGSSRVPDYHLIDTKKIGSSKLVLF